MHYPSLHNKGTQVTRQACNPHLIHNLVTIAYMRGFSSPVFKVHKEMQSRSALHVMPWNKRLLAMST